MVETVSLLRGRWGRKGGELIPEVTLVSPRHLPLSETGGPGARGEVHPLPLPVLSEFSTWHKIEPG